MLYMFIGIVAVTFLAVVGSIASRKLNFNYVYFTPVSLAIYTLVAYYSSKDYNLVNAILANAIVGLYDGTVGLKLSLFFKANIKISKEEFEGLNTPAITLMNIILAVIFAFVGYYFAK